MPELPPPTVSVTPPGGFSFQPPWSEVTALDEGEYRIRLGGFFGPAWMASLCRALAEHRLSIQRAHAIRARNQSWMVEFVVSALPGAADPCALPIVEFTAGQDVQDAPPLALRSYELVDTDDHNGTLRLTIDAEDTLGLLGALLAQLAALLIFPVEMHIDTRAGMAHDCFWLGALGVERPTAEGKQALTRLLDDALVR